MTSTWSFSRDQTLHTCERRYYYQYLSSARINSRDELLREIAFLKKLSNVSLWKGNSFHSLIADFLRSARMGRQPRMAAILVEYRKQMEKQWQFSANCNFRNDPRLINDDEGLALFEHEYQENTPNFDSIFQDVTEWAYSFENWAINSEFIDDLQRSVRYWIEPPTFGPGAIGFPLDGVQVLTKVDLAILRPDGMFDIYDWKTGKPSTDVNHSIYQAEFQVNVYQIWPHVILDQPLETIRAHLVYIAHGPEERTFLIDQNLLEYTLGIVRRSISRALHFENLQKQDGLKLNNLDYAPYAGACKKCSFKRICQREL
jgi:CRISPR/Cas system-associated exonuclease Cas4 (RecB family)